MKFKVGDHVIGNKKSWYSITKQGWRGEVVEVRDGGSITVKALPGYYGGDIRFPVAAECFDLIEPTDNRKIVVTADGKTTTARLYDGKTVLKSAEAKCSPKDTFDFEVGAGLAVDRLLGRKTEEPVTPDAIPFNRAFLTTGRFGHTNLNKWFVVVGDHLVYLRGSDGWDDIRSFGENGITPHNHSIDLIVEAESLYCAMLADREGDYIWKRNK